MREALSLDDARTARKLGLRLSQDDRPGLMRARHGKTFSYRTATGATVDDARTLQRLRALAIPPAWTDVWICADARGHLQATGRDAKGRKQYRYHPTWRAHREALKFGRMVEFGQALHAVRRQTAQHLRRRSLDRSRVLAALVTLLEKTLIRVGNEEYARENHHYGLTTLRASHVKVQGSTLRFGFVGKSGKRREVELKDRRLAKVVGALLTLRGRALWHWLDEDGTRHRVTSGDVNAYLRELSGTDFTAKNFRTWAATVLAAEGLHQLVAGTKTATRKLTLGVVRQVSERLGNTPAVCRASYIHPHVLAAFSEGALQLAVEPPKRDEHLTPMERAVLAFLTARDARPARNRRVA